MAAGRELVSALLEAMMGYRVTQAIHVAAKLRVPDMLVDGPRPSGTLARLTGTHPEALHRLLRALVNVGLFEELDDGRFALTPMGDLLRTGTPSSLRGAAVFFGHRWHWERWAGLADSVMAGVPRRGVLAPGAFSELAAEDPEAAAVLNEAMTSLTAPVNAAIAGMFDFSTIGTLVDVGGGHGALLSTVLLANPGLRGVLFDIPAVIDGAKPRMEAAGLMERCQLLGGDFFEKIPAGGDAYILKWIIHDWDDERSVTILRNCHSVMSDSGTLLLVERLMPERVKSSAAPSQEPAFADLNMLVLTGGRERTEDEFRTLLDASGFVLTRIMPTPRPWPQVVLEARRRPGSTSGM
jgi:O-methyltransferase/methyltransferase family protein